MNVNTQKIKGKIRELGYTQKQFAEALGIDISTLNRKLNASAKSFTMGEVYKITQLLSLSPQECNEIFFAQKSHFCDLEGNYDSSSN